MNKVLLCILDGWGIRPDQSETDATQSATYFWDLLGQNPHTFLHASGRAVGLPSGQIGNSEVGHTTIGLGRIVPQDLCRIDDALEDRSFFNVPAFQRFVEERKRTRSCCHLLGLLSPGGVHSHMQHMIKVIACLASHQLNVKVHVVLDGRDTAPTSALSYISEFEHAIENKARIVSLSGRFYAMDRDQRWDRTEQAYRLIAEQTAERHAETCAEAIEKCYADNITDEFIPPFCIGEPYEVRTHDGLFFINYRSDRARQITQALGDPHFDVFARSPFPRFHDLLSMTEYDERFQDFCDPIFRKEPPVHSLGTVLGAHHLPQVRLAETEKYAHVTFFFNGGQEAAVAHEERILVASPKVSTYDQTPHMSAKQITNYALRCMEQEKTNLIVMNYANPDMLGHTGNLSATQEAVRFIDQCLRHLVAAANKHHYTALITADHGNAEKMANEDGSPYTAHTSNVVPFIALNLPRNFALRSMNANDTTQGLSDIAPTVLNILGLDIPEEMTGHPLTHEEE